MMTTSADDVLQKETKVQQKAHFLPDSPWEDDSAAAKARAFAASHILVKNFSKGFDLLKSLNQVEILLGQAYPRFREASDLQSKTSHTAEWVLDNYYIIQQAIRQIRQDMPRGYYRQLPRIENPPYGIVPRIHAFVQLFLQTCQAQVDAESLERFVRAYQEVSPLTTGELWALPVMLRYGVLQCLTNIIVKITAIKAPEKLAASLAEPIPCQWNEEAVVSFAILSLRTISAIDWKTFVETVSVVDAVLRTDPGQAYPFMDFETRNRYRGEIEHLSLHMQYIESEIAYLAIGLAQAAQQDQNGQNLPQTHVGYYLVDAGRQILEQKIGYRPSARFRLHRFLLQHPTPIYLGSITLFTILLLACGLLYIDGVGGSWIDRAVFIILGWIPALSMAIGLTNWSVTQIIPPRILPKMDFEKGIPAGYRTAIVIPSLLIDHTEIDHLLHQSELHYLGNNDPNFLFVLLTDFVDANQENLPEDNVLLEHAMRGIDALNGKYRQGNQTKGPFLLLNRSRQWNPGENCWMGWERKRGKLADFNQLLLGNADHFSQKSGNIPALQGIRYVITLDADTSLPRDAAQRLAATLAHPLNQAYLASDGKIERGYNILQPRVQTQPAVVNQSWLTRIFAGESGLDPYTHAISDVYQDLFGEGIYVGKGIYEVATFENSLRNRIPENALLSHDLFEGIHGRVGLATDISLFEDHPTHYLANSHRYHRWARGDWQISPWLLPTVFDARGIKIFNNLSWINRWKILDNLRRTLFPITLLGFLLAGWLVLSGNPLFWTLAGFLAQTTPVLTSILSKTTSLNKKQLLKRGDTIIFSFAQTSLALLFLPYESLNLLDAIATTLFRMWFSHKKMLQWRTMAHTIRVFGKSRQLALIWTQMRAAPVLAIFFTALIILVSPQNIGVAAPFLLAWFFSPQIAYRISQPFPRKLPTLNENQAGSLRRLACRTWMFFEHFVTPEDNWLPPDHFQEEPRGLVVHHTSPTNIGLCLTSTLAAYELGFVSSLSLSLRLSFALESLGRLERYHGHFLNWYDTRTLRPLYPRYVSTVDSGNLACSFIIMSQSLKEMAGSRFLRRQYWLGLADILDVLDECLKAWCKADAALNTQIQPIQLQLAKMRQLALAVTDDPAEWINLLEKMQDQEAVDLGLRLVDLIQDAPKHLDSKVMANLHKWVSRIHHHLESKAKELSILAPWLSTLYHPPERLTQLTSLDDPALVECWQDLEKVFIPGTLLRDLPAICQKGQQLAASLQARLVEQNQKSSTKLWPEGQMQDVLGWCRKLEGEFRAGAEQAQALLLDFASLGQKALEYFYAMDFSFLFHVRRQVFHIGYNLDIERLDDNYYDLLASEARLASYIAIVKGDVPQSHWLHLARPITQIGGIRLLLSWSGTMFEYLMPLLFMKSEQGTLLDQSCQAAVQQQIVYGRQKHTPWGISEAGYYHFDAQQNYQYRAFGVPRLGFKRGLEDDLVIAPYASVMAVSYEPLKVVDNLRLLKELEGLGCYGYYDALDFTPTRLSAGEDHHTVKSYYAHHQGMILAALVNYLEENYLVRCFHANPLIESGDLLLHEFVPRQAPVEQPHPSLAPVYHPIHLPNVMEAWEPIPDAPIPQAHLLSNGRFSTLITNNGGGYCAWNGRALTRWQADSTLDHSGMWLYIYDPEGDIIWSATRQPGSTAPENYQVQYRPHRVEFKRQDHDLTVRTEITVPPEDDLDIRYVTLTNHRDTPRRLRILSYAEVVLARQIDDHRHPAFNKLFIESAYLPEINTLLFSRRPRSSQEEPIFLAHSLLGDPGIGSERFFCCARPDFLGRNGDLHSPAILHPGRTLPASPAQEIAQLTTELDPIFSIGLEIVIPAHKSTKIAFLSAAANSREKALKHIQHYQTWSQIEHSFEQAESFMENLLSKVEFNLQELPLAQKLLSLLLYPNGLFRAPASTIALNRMGQPGLWRFAISGDDPILLARIGNEEEASLAMELVKAHAYWRSFNLSIDLVFLNLRDTGYNQDLQNLILRLLQKTGADLWLNHRGGIYLLRVENLSTEEHILLETSARVILDGKNGALSIQLANLARPTAELPRFVATLPPVEAATEPELTKPSDLRFENGLGGFSPDGKEYVIYLPPGEHTPAPWVNILANPYFGCLISEAGAGYTWAHNSGENRLTPWRNDPLVDPSGEALYLRDEETGQVWSPTPQPANSGTPYVVRHGAGYTIFDNHSYGLRSSLQVFVLPDAPVKVIQLCIENTLPRTRRISVTYYAEWVLGTDREKMQPYISTEFNTAHHAILAHNPFNTEFTEQVAFLSSTRETTGLTTERSEFLGRNGNLSEPAALKRVGLTGTSHTNNDPCGALQNLLWIAPGEKKEVTFLLGWGSNQIEALDLLQKYRNIQAVADGWERLNIFWDKILGAVTVQTPDPSMDILLNRWLLYQALACRIWGRSALYQSSGAFGFRDQLQDILCLVHSLPEVARAYILDAAQHQFQAGDVLHWWHPPSGRGVRTRCSDDLLWLPYVTAVYVTSTGDTSILEERLAFLQGEPLSAEEHERYNLYPNSAETATLLEHCQRALEKGVTSGKHGLPLIGSHDWNDGLNRVGIQGKGESIWNAWFLCSTLNLFANFVGEEKGALYRMQASAFAQMAEEHAWDGKWYLRAFYDDGTPLGSSKSLEAQIDSLPQSWAVLSQSADPSRARLAMQSVYEKLVRTQEGLVLLFTPPFDQTDHDPGYIKGYAPGIRENGGQYTHAATWVAWAFTLLGENDRAGELFRLLNPIQHSSSPEQAQHYRVEPYVIAADIYGVRPYSGRGGWTWYTGSAAWMYRLGLEAILGIHREGKALRLAPRIPADWANYKVCYRFGSAVYHIQVENPRHSTGTAIRQLTLDDQTCPDGRVPLCDDGKEHTVRLEME